jgi:hypothetical protein
VRCTKGTWSDAGSYALTWQLDGADVASGQTYTVPSQQQGSTLTCTVTATGPGGTGQAMSDPVTIT